MLVLIFCSCKKDGANTSNTSNTNTNSPVDVYVAGYEYDGSNGTIAVAKYWKNGQATPITYGSINSFANSIAVSNGNVYIAETSLGAAVWSSAFSSTGFFGGSSQQSGTNSIIVLGSTVYVAGYDYNGSVSVAKYWAWPFGPVGPGPGGAFLSLTDGTRNAMGNSVTVVGTDAYVAGYEHNGSGISVAKYWKNTQPIDLTDGTKSAVATSIVVVGSDIYIAGSENKIAKYWKNGQAITLPAGDTATSIVVAGTDVYVAGVGNNVAKYWKNGQAITLPGGTSATSIAIVGSDIYVAGYGYNGSFSVAKYWKNGVAIPLTDGTKNASAASIVVVKR